MRKPVAAALAVVLVALLWLFGRGESGPAGQASRPPEASREGPPQPPADGGGQAPPVTLVEIVPSSPDRRAVVRVRAEVAHQEADPAMFSYRWTVNDEEVGETGPLLSMAPFRPGDRVAVEVLPAAGGGEALRRSAPVEIVNNPPVVTAIRLVPPEPKAGEEVRAEVEGLDREGDPITYAYEWVVNEKPVEGQNGAALDGQYIRSADRVAVVVTPSDPFGEGSPKISQLVPVTNRPPEITSRPPAAADGGTYAYQLAATDPDGDTVSYRLVEGPAGMSLDPASGRLEWVPQPLPEQQAAVTLQVEDGKGGRSVQRFVVQTP